MSSSNAATSSSIETVAISGASGMVGTALARFLESEGKSVLAMTRQTGGTYQDTIHWDPATGLTNPNRLESVDAVVHLAGENIAAGRWNSTVKSKIRSSRIEGTRSLVNSMATVEKRPKVLVCASAIGFYGDRGLTELNETSAAGSGFLADVCRDWEAEANAAKQLDVRVVNIRIGVVLSPKGGALSKMMLPFKLGLGGIIGSGNQYWSWVGLNDLVRIIAFCINNECMDGPVNAVSPTPLTNREFTKEIGSVLKRPTIFPVPAFAAKMVMGEMAESLLLSSTRVLPELLRQAGFKFEQPELKECLKYELAAE